MYDFSNIAQQAAAIASQGDKSSDYKYGLVYPGVGTINVRLLYNPKSSLITRLIYRHTIGNTKVPCLKTWGEDCPICKLIDDIKNATGNDLFQYKSKSRGLSFVQYINSTYTVGNQQHPINPNDVVVLMYPWTVYKNLNEYISQIASTPTGMMEAFTQRESYAIGISRSQDNKYQVTPNPYMRHSDPTISNDDEFRAFIENIDSLSDQVLPAMITEDVINQVNLAVEELTKEYLRPKTTFYQPSGTGVAPVSTMYQNINQNTNQDTPASQSVYVDNDYYAAVFKQNPVPQQVVQTTTQVAANPVTNGPVPACFGKYAGTPPCMMCPSDLECKKASGK